MTEGYDIKLTGYWRREKERRMKQNSDAKPNEKIIIHVDSDLKDLIPGYLENRRKDIESIIEALKQSDFETIRILGHSMKGSGAGYGFDAITHIGDSFEQAAIDKDSAEVQKQVGKLALYLGQIEIVYSD